MASMVFIRSEKVSSDRQDFEESIMPVSSGLLLCEAHTNRYEWTLSSCDSLRNIMDEAQVIENLLCVSLRRSPNMLLVVS